MVQTNEYSYESHMLPLPEVEGITIRHLKSGRTGARKTWTAAPVLLRYLAVHDGLRSLGDKSIEQNSTLDMSIAPSDPPEMRFDQAYNILELGGGSGYVSVGLAKLLRSSSSQSCNSKIMCTDMDKNTLKNMKHNVYENKETKMVAIEKLEWGDDVGGENFFKALGRKFSETKTMQKGTEATQDPVQHLTHVIGSDVHYGETTLDPLSSIVSALKVRNPDIQVVLLIKERGIGTVDELVEQIEIKLQGNDCNLPVYVRDIYQNSEPTAAMKLIEC
jgi:hypothetical protein